MLAVAALCSGCDTSTPEPPAPPPLRLLRVLATTSYAPQVGADPAQATVLSPVRQEVRPPAALTITRSASVVLELDRLLLPVSVIRQAICLRPSTDPVASIADCGEPYQAFTEPEYNPVRRTVTYRLPRGDRLLPATLYRLTVFPRPADNDSGLLAFDGAPLDRTYTFDLLTQGSGSLAVDEPLPTPQRYCDAISCVALCEKTPSPATCVRSKCDCTGSDIQLADGSPYDACVDYEGDLHSPPSSPLSRSCALDGCHGSSLGDQQHLAAGLDLSSPAAIALTVLNRTAHQTQQGEAAQVAELSPDRFGRAMPLIDPGNPGNSYLLYKLIANPLSYRRTAVPTAEIQRLRESVVVGLPMPAEGTLPLLSDEPDPLGDLAQASLELINAWIAHGAVTDCSRYE